jgi:tetratricopeptide (TPR) repeat protein
MLQQWDDARRTITEALEVARAHDLVDIEAIAYRTLVEIASNVGDDSHSIGWLLEARELVEATGNKIYAQKIEMELGLAYMRKGKRVEARETLLNALDLAERAASPQLLAETHLALASFYERESDVGSAVRHLHHALEQDTELHSDANKLAVRRLERRVTPDKTTRVQPQPLLLDTIAERQAVLTQDVLKRIHASIQAVREESHRLGNAGKHLDREIEMLSDLVRDLDMVHQL